jgi:membrane protein YdbS with pleckstrin-like domain
MPDVFLAKDKKKKKRRGQGPEIKKTGNQFVRKVLKGRVGKDQHPLSAFRLYPYKTEFFQKDPEEQVILLLRRHPITNISWILIALIMLFIPSFVTVMPDFELLPSGFQLILVIVWYLITAAFVFEKFLGWFYHVNIITDERIFDINFIHLVYREMSDANIDQIQDVTVEVGSPLRTVLNYGNVLIQTAAQIPQIKFESVPQPDKVARILRELRIEEEVEKLEGRIR